MARSRRKANSPPYEDEHLSSDSSDDRRDDQYDTDPTEPDCEDDQLKDADPQQEFLKLSVGILYTFLDWALNLRRGKNGRRLPGIKRKSSLETFWKVFRLVFERATSGKIENRMNRQIRRVRIPPLPNHGTVVLPKTL
ncbi:unnamed protein product [Penicillium viridicatum]